MSAESMTVDASRVSGTGMGLVRVVRWEPTDEGRRPLVGKEWLVTNGLGGYASGTLSGALTRRYHAYLVAALPTPFGRTVMLNYLWERIGHRDYKPQYYGDLRSRDAAYHQGTVWAWLVGPYVDAYLRVHPGDLTGARECLAGFETHLNEAGIGTISEIFDADPPYTPRGCIAQAWSVAEVLRAWLKTEARRGRYRDFILSRAAPSALISSPYVAQSPARCASIARW